MRALLALAALGAIAAALTVSSATPDRAAGPAASVTATPTASVTVTPARTPAPPTLKATAINRQDRVSAAHRTREARAFDARPLLTRLPVRRAGVRIDLIGLTPDNTRAVLSVDAGARSRAHAREVLHQVLREHHDPGTSYRLVWAR